MRSSDGAMNNLFRRYAVVGNKRSADGRTDFVGMPRNLDFTLERFDKAHSNRVSGVSIEIVRKHCKLIAAEPC